MSMRYSALLLFQYRPVGEDSVIRVCEKKMLLFYARSDRDALSKAKRKGKRLEIHSGLENGNGYPVRFEFVGLLDLRCMDGYDSEEVWYDIVHLKQPSERAAKLIPSDEHLLECAAGCAPPKLSV